MPVELRTPGVDGLGEVLTRMRDWQHDGSPTQLHPGDVGWFWRFGAAATAAAVRTWDVEGRVLAIGLLDEPTVLRLAIAPDAQLDEALARRVVGDLSGPGGGVFGGGTAYVEAPAGALVRDLLAEAGWEGEQPWSPLRRDLSAPVEDPGVRIEVTGPEDTAARVAVQRAAFDNSTFTDERWRDMAAGPAYADARCLVAYDDRGAAVAAVTVWSAGPGRPGLIEPMGVHREHRGHGYGKAVTVAAAGALQQVGSSSVLVTTPSSNVGGVATYVAAGFERLPETRDLRRDG